MLRTVLTLIALTFTLSLANTACTNPPAETNANDNGNTNTSAENANANTGAPDTNLTREDFDKKKDEYATKAREAGRRIGKGADDLWIWTKASAALAAGDDLRDSTINVDVDNGVATLSGSVASVAQRTKAEQTAKSVQGVKRVVNQLKVSTASGGKK